MHITNLKLKNWRNFSNVSIDLQRRAFFVGPNASGKSNLLDALRFVRDLVLPNGGGLQPAIESRGGIPAMRSLYARARSNIFIELTLGDDETPKKWTYTLEFNASTGEGLPRIVRELVRKDADAETLLSRPDADDVLDPERLTQTALQQVNANKSFRDIAEFLASIRYLHVVPQIVREPNRSGGKDDPFGGDLIERINATTKKTRDARLKRMEEALKVAVPQMEELQLDVDTKGIPFLRAKYKHWRPQGAWQKHDTFSDGTLRLLGLIWSLQEHGGPLLLEEPELSLNPGVVEQLAPLISKATRRSKRQVLITSHSQDLLSNNARAEETFLLVPGLEGTELRSSGTADDIKAEVDAGIPLGEILLAKSRAKEVERLPLLDLMQQ